MRGQSVKGIQEKYQFSEVPGPVEGCHDPDSADRSGGVLCSGVYRATAQSVFLADADRLIVILNAVMGVLQKSKAEKPWML